MKELIRKYLAVLRAGISSALEYRFNFLFQLFITVSIGVVVQVFLWNAVYESSTSPIQIGNFTHFSLLVYIAIAGIISSITKSGKAERSASDEIRLGTISKYIVKPISHIGYVIFSSVAERTATFIGTILILLLFGTPFFLYFSVSFSIVNIVLAFPLILIGIVANILMGLLLSYLAFWVDETWTFHVIKDISTWFLSGSLVPYSALPKVFETMFNYLPFQFLASTPALIITQGVTPHQYFFYLALGVVWLVVLWGLNMTLFRVGIRYFAAFGN